MSESTPSLAFLFVLMIGCASGCSHQHRLLYTALPLLFTTAVSTNITSASGGTASATSCTTCTTATTPKSS
uniref:Putative secreted protein n=1 Tax=Panstrongylus lignarius TaxID=156445 RepID=A0A224XUC4_9HEMI